MRHRRLPRVDLPHRSYYLTCCTDRRRPHLARPALAQCVLDLYADLRAQRGIMLHGYVFMPDHYHVALTLRAEPSISGVVRKVHSLSAARWRGSTGLRGRLWQEPFYDHVIRADEDWRTKLAYMHDNLVRAGLVEAAVAYPWSSAALWETGRGPVTCDAATW